jgi:phosphoglycolate phosphatase
MKPFDLIALDWNGTLLDDAELSAQCISTVCEHFGLPKVSLAKYKQSFRFPIIEYYRKIGLEDRFSDASRMFFELYNERKGELNLFHDAVSFIEFCKTISVKTVILTAGREDIIEDEAFSHFLDLTVWGPKSMPSEGKMTVAEELNEWITFKVWPKKSRVLIVGDTIEDIACAKLLKWDFYAVCTGHCSRKRLLKNTQSVADSLDEVQEYLMSDLDIGRN